MSENTDTQKYMYIGTIVFLSLCLCSSCIALIGVSSAYSSQQVPSEETCKDKCPAPTADSCKDKCPAPTADSCKDKCPSPTADPSKDKCPGPTADSCKNFIPSSVSDFAIDFSSYSRNPDKICRPSGTTDSDVPSEPLKYTGKGIMPINKCKEICDSDPTCSCFDMGGVMFNPPNGNVIGYCNIHQNSNDIAIKQKTPCDRCIAFVKNK